MYTQTFSTCWHFTWTVTLFIYFKVSTSVASTRLILVSDWLIAIYNNNNNFFDECIPWWMCYSLLWRGVLGMGDCGWELVAHANSSNVIPAITNLLTFFVSVYAQKFQYQMNTPIFRTRKAQLVMDIYCYAPVESSLSLGRLWTTVCVSFIFPGYRYMHLWVTVQFLSLSYMKLLCYCPFIVSAVSRLFDTCLFMLFL